MTSQPSSIPPAILLMGATASGKTALALALAEHLPIEIISVDSALVYWDMDIGTAKPSAEERAVCPHHLIDIISPLEAYSAARFAEDACRLMAEIQARGNVPVLVGGTMLYFKALHDGLSDLPSADPALRLEIEAMAAAEGWPAVHAQLAALDPEAALRFKPTDAQRIQRALEIVRLTGRPLAESYAQKEELVVPCPLLPIAIHTEERGLLHQRIEQRFDQMLAQGLVDEVEHLRRFYPELTPSMTSMRCVGYRQVWDFLDGQGDYAEMRFKGVVATRQLAKRQITWMRQFREQWPELHMLDCLSPQLVQQVVDIYLQKKNRNF